MSPAIECMIRLESEIRAAFEAERNKEALGEDLLDANAFCFNAHEELGLRQASESHHRHCFKTEDEA